MADETTTAPAAAPADFLCPNSVYGCEFKGPAESLDEHLTLACEKQQLKDRITAKETEVKALRDDLARHEEELNGLRRELGGPRTAPVYADNLARLTDELNRTVDNIKGSDAYKKTAEVMASVGEKTKEGFIIFTEKTKDGFNRLAQSDAIVASKAALANAGNAAQRKFEEIRESDTVKSFMEKARASVDKIGGSLRRDSKGAESAPLAAE
eukprot:Opistho-2@69693